MTSNLCKCQPREYMSNFLEKIAPIEQDRKHVRLFLIFDFLYLFIVFSWIIFLPVSSSEFLWFQSLLINNSVPFYDSPISATTFYCSAVALRIFNFLLLYLIMVLIFFTTHFLTNGLWWLGSLAAVLFMAHPLIQPQIIQINGYEVLLPFLTALLLLFLFSYSIYTQSFHFLFIWLFAVLAMFLSPFSIPFVIIISVWILLQGMEYANTYPSRKHILLALIFLLPVFFFLYLHRHDYSFSFDFIPQLSLLIYPIGWLRETQEYYNSSYLLPILYETGTLLFLIFIAYKVCNVGIILLLFGTVLSCMFIDRKGINLSYPLNNPQSLFPLLLLCIAISGLCGIIQKQPRWKMNIVKITTLFCILMMGCQMFLNGWYAHSINKTQQISESIFNDINEKGINDFILFPASIEYRWSTWDIYSALLQRNLLSESNKRVLNIIPLCKFNFDSTCQFTTAVNSFSEKSLIINIKGLSYNFIYPSQTMIPVNKYGTAFINTIDGSIIEFLKKGDEIDITVSSKDKILSKNLFLWDNKEKTFILITCK